MKRMEPSGTPRSQTILYLEDDRGWHRTVGRILSAAGYSVLLFDDCEEAQKYYAEHESEITVALCDGSVNESGDGRNWATELHENGKKAVILSTMGARGVPLVSKAQTESLLSTLEKVIGGQ